MDGDGVDLAEVPSSSSSSPARSEKSAQSAQSDDSRHYEGVYYGSSSDDDVNITAALLRDTGQPDDDEEPFDILADNGEFSYGEEDQRQYTSVATSPPSIEAMDLMMSRSEGTTSPTMASISEDGEENNDEVRIEEVEEEEDLAGAGAGALSSTPKKSNRSSSHNVGQIDFQPKKGVNLQEQLRPPSPPTAMYQIPADYKVQSASFDSQTPSENDSGTDSEGERSSASSSILTGSIRKLMRDIDGVLDNMNSQTYSQVATNPNPIDDDSIVTDMSVGATTQLSDELDRAKEGFEKENEEEEKKDLVPRPSPQNDSSNENQQTQRGSKTSTKFLLFACFAAFIGILVAIFVFLRSNKDQTTSEISMTSLPPSLSPVTDNDLIVIDSGSSKTTRPTIQPSTESPSFTPSLRPTKRFWIPVTLPPSRGQDEISDPTVQPTQQLLTPPTRTEDASVTLPPSRGQDEISDPTVQPTQQLLVPVPSSTEDTSITLPPSRERDEISDFTVQPTQQLLAPTQTPTKDIPVVPAPQQSPLPTSEKDTPNVGEVGGGDSFPLPNNSTITRPWDDDDLIEGLDDFYSNDDSYKYEQHHPDHKASKKGKQNKKGTSNVDEVGDEDSFALPNSSSNTRPWDDDDLIEGLDDFYSNDDSYKYEQHHPNHKASKKGKQYGKQESTKKSKQKIPKTPKVSKHGHIDPLSSEQQKYRQLQQQIPP